MPLFLNGGFTQTRFLGASVSNVASSIGWNGDTSSLDLTLVEDTSSGDAFHGFYSFYGEIGSPKYFTIGSFSFGGYVTNWKYNQSTSGYLIQCQLQVPMNILQGVQIILDGYHGTTFNRPNLYNLFGYYEPTEQDFGAALTNEAGMLWSKIKIIDSVISAFPIKYKGESYRIDISDIKAIAVPQYYRVSSNGGAITLLDLISQVVSDAGCDYTVSLEPGNVFVFRLVSRKEQPMNLNTIQNYVISTALPNQRAFGKELRNDGPTNAFIVGPAQQRLWMLEQTGGIDGDEPLNNGFWPYWGKDSNDQIILGQGVDDAHYIDIDVSKSGFSQEIGTTYRLTVGEMRAALNSREAWNLYVTCVNTPTAVKLGMTTTGPAGDLALMGGLANWGKLQAMDLFKPTEENTFYLEEKVNRLFNIILDYANRYGSEYMVRIPFAVRAIEPETLIKKTSWEIADSGFMDEEEANPLGLLEQYEELFKTEDGKYICFVRYDNPDDLDLGQYTDDNALFQGEIVEITPPSGPNRINLGYDTFRYDGALYVKAEATEIVYDENDDPWVVIKLASPALRLEKRDWIRGKGLLYLLTNQNEQIGLNGDLKDPANAATKNARQEAAFRDLTANFGYAESITDMHPAAQMPLKAAIPLKSNMLTYGPWYTDDGADGPQHYEQDENLAPWNYNSFDLLNLVARAKITGMVSRMQVGEMGDCTVPGIPDKSLGDELQAGGPNITNISISIDPQSGITTSYQLRTYTPVFGVFSKDFVERLSRMARSTRRLTREAELKALSRFNISQLQRAQVINKQKAIGTGMQANSGNSPTVVLMGRQIDLTPEDDETPIRNHTYRPFVQGTPVSEYGPYVKGASYYRDTAVMSMDGLLRPFRTDSTRSLNAQTQDILPNFPSGLPVMNNYNIHKTTGDQPSSFIYSRTLDPFQSGCDISMLSFGETYPSGGINLYQRDLYAGSVIPSGEQVRAMGLRGPMVMVGWGYDWLGRPVPAKDFFYDSEEDGEDEYNCNMPLRNRTESIPFDGDYLKNPSKWKAGPIDLRWYPGRGVWAGYSPVILGRAAEDCPSSSGSMLVKMGFHKPNFSTGADCLASNENLDQGNLNIARCHFWLSHPCISSGTALVVQYNAIDDLHYITNFDC